MAVFVAVAKAAHGDVQRPDWCGYGPPGWERGRVRRYVMSPRSDKSTAGRASAAAKWARGRPSPREALAVQDI